MRVADRADQNFSSHITYGLAALPAARTIVGPDLTVGDSGLACDHYNIIGCARLTPRTAVERIERTIDLFRRTGRPFSWWVGPADQPGNLGDLLVAAGLVPSESEQAMSADLRRLETVNLRPAGLVVKRVSSAEELGQLARLHGGWASPDPMVIRFYQEAAAELLKPTSPRWFFLGYLEGEPVAAAEVTMCYGVAGLYGVTTREEYRRRGFGLALSAVPLLAARDAGADLGVLQAAEGVEGFYRKLGFETFGSIREYKPA